MQRSFHPLPREQHQQARSRASSGAPLHVVGGAGVGAYESGASMDRTTLVLDKSASFQARPAADRARGGSGGGGAPGGGHGSMAPGGGAAGGGGGGAGPYQSFAPLEDLVNAVTEGAVLRGARSVGGASVASAGGGALQRRGSLPMLQPEFISSPKLARCVGGWQGACGGGRQAGA
jgi:hypothetical protein